MGTPAAWSAGSRQCSGDCRGQAAEQVGQQRRRRLLELVVAAVRRRPIRSASGGRWPRGGIGRPGGGRRPPRTRARAAPAPTTGPCRGSSATWRRAAGGPARRRRPRPCAHSRHGWSCMPAAAVGLQELDQLGALGHREGRGHPDVLELPVGVPQAEEQRADQRARPVLVPAEAGDHAVGGAGVLDLRHRPLARLVRAVGALGDHAVEAGALEDVEPVAGDRRIGGRRRQAHRFGRIGDDLARDVRGARRTGGRGGRPPPSARQSKATNEAGDCSASIRTRDAAGWMRSSSESKSSPPSGRAITTSPSSTKRASGPPSASSGACELREVSVQGLEVARLEVDLGAVAKDEGAEAIPLRLVAPAVADRDLGRRLGQHRLEGRLEGEGHGPMIRIRPDRLRPYSGPPERIHRA